MTTQISIIDDYDSLLTSLSLQFESKGFWSKKELLAEEFKSLGFYISDHPLNEYKEFFSELEIGIRFVYRIETF